MCRLRYNRRNQGTRGNGNTMTARIVVYVGDEPMEEYCADCNAEILDNDICPNNCDEEIL